MPRLNGLEVLRRIREQSTLPIKNAKRMHENVRLFDDAIKGAGAKTKPAAKAKKKPPAGKAVVTVRLWDEQVAAAYRESFAAFLVGRISSFRCSRRSA